MSAGSVTGVVEPPRGASIDSMEWRVNPEGSEAITTYPLPIRLPHQSGLSNTFGCVDAERPEWAVIAAKQGGNRFSSSPAPRSPL